MSYRVVSPYRPFPPESEEHRALGPFDWIHALRMLDVSVKQFCGCPVFAITDVDTDLPVVSYRFHTEQRRLMLWILDVTLRYLDSEHFDRDTILISPDSLVFGDIGYWFGPKADLSVLLRVSSRYHHAGRPILNSVQWFRYRSKKRLIRFYEEVLALACTLPDATIQWGADSEPIRQLLEPLAPGIQKRSGLIVDCINADWVIESLSKYAMVELQQGVCRVPTRPILDFKFTRKLAMARYFDLAFGSAVLA